DEPRPGRGRGHGDDRARVHRAHRSRTADGIRTRTEQAHRDGHGRIRRIMTEAVAEKEYVRQASEQHGNRAHTDGDWDSRVPVQTRSQRPKSTNVADFPVVAGREAVWKFTPIA